MDQVGGLRSVYLCNPALNTTCSRTWCFYTTEMGECIYTTNPEYSLDGIEYGMDELVRYKKNYPTITKD